MKDFKAIINKYERQKFLYGGEMFFEKEPTLVWTVLGSCVAICFHNKKRKIGAIFHAQLPQRKKDANSQCSEQCPVKCLQDGEDDSPYKYVECGINNIIQQFKREGIKPFEINVKAFGGASMITKIDSPLTSVGEQNIQRTFHTIESYGLKIQSKNLGGRSGRKLYFLTDTGEVFLKHLQGKAIKSFNFLG